MPLYIPSSLGGFGDAVRVGQAFLPDFPYTQTSSGGSVATATNVFSTPYSENPRGQIIGRARTPDMPINSTWMRPAGSYINSWVI